MRKFGLIGYPLHHSFSQQFFTGKFDREHIPGCSYSNFPLTTIEDFPVLLKKELLSGLNVTIPYKQLVIPFLDFPDAIVQQIGACNCIKIRDGKLYGFNTDTIGFERSLLKQLQPSHRNALVLGNGGAAKAVLYVLEKLGINYSLVSRKPVAGSDCLNYEQLNKSVIEQHQLIINTSPVGMLPNADACPQLPYEFIVPTHYLFDLIYNPAETLFLKKGKANGALVQNGYDMLVIQAEESWKIWNS